jgi:predicted DNA-binding transcriptional regulator AlpA
MDAGEPAPARVCRRRRKPEYVPDDPLLGPTEASAERGTGKSTFWRDVKAGLVPPPTYVGPRMPRWRRSTIRRTVPG